MPSDLELLLLEIETIWDCDARSRVLQPGAGEGGPAPLLVLACAPGTHAVRLGAAVPGPLSGEIERLVAATPVADDPSLLSPALAACQRLLRAEYGETAVTSGPSYVVPPGTTFATNAEVVTSAAAPAWLRTFAPEEANWPADEWPLLLAGSLGPWAMAIAGESVLAVCHSARLTPAGAEAGVWTHPGHRGRGFAAATTAAWAELALEGGRTVFYSTSESNRSSQAVAARLSLRPIGWLWQLAPGRDAASVG